MANSQGRVSVCLYYNITILCGNTIQRTYFIWLTAKVEFHSQGRASVCLYYNITILCVKVQYNVRTLYGYQPR